MTEMADSGLKKRKLQQTAQPPQESSAGNADDAEEPHPAGEIKYGPAMSLLRMLAFAAWFISAAFCIMVTQFVGAPLYFISKDYYYAWMALTKQSFGIIVDTLIQWFSPTLFRISWDASLRGELRQTSDGLLETSFPERMVLMANHQLYTDWLYLWWIAYTSRMHGHIYIILKESLKYIPVLGPGMMFFGFIFMSRKWASDQDRLQHRLSKLKTRHAGPLSGEGSLDPMWLLIYPEGTNLSANTRKGSKKWADKQGIPDLVHTILPRSTGLLYCLRELGDTVDWVYDCTVAYEGVPKGGYAQDYFTLRSLFFQGRPPRSVNMYWRRFAVSAIPLDDLAAFEKWLADRWQEKDQLMDHYMIKGMFPADNPDATGKSNLTGYIETKVKLRSMLELGQIFLVVATILLITNVTLKLSQMLS